MRKVCLVILAVLVFFLKDCTRLCAASTTTIFYKGGVISMDQPAFEIRQVYGVRLLPKSSTIKSREIEVFFPHAIENLSNATNSIDIEVINTGSSKGPAADLIMDDNGDGVHQEQENTQQKASVELGEGAVMHFFLRMKAPADARSGDSFSATIKASCQVKDGAGYVGDNGIIYGGDDESVSTDTLAIE